MAAGRSWRDCIKYPSTKPPYPAPGIPFAGEFCRFVSSMAIFLPRGIPVATRLASQFSKKISIFRHLARWVLFPVLNWEQEFLNEPLVN